MDYFAFIKNLIQPNTNFSFVKPNEDGANQGEISADSSIFAGVLSQYDTNNDQQISSEEYQQILKDIEELELAQEQGKSVDSSNPFAQLISKAFTKESFSKEMNSINDFLSENGIENAQIKDIQEMGIENFFALVDNNGDSIINSNEFSNFFEKGLDALTKGNENFNIDELNDDSIEYDNKDYSSYKFDQFLNDIGLDKKDASPSDLMKEKNNSLAKYSDQITNLNKQLNNLIETSLSDDDKLKANYKKSQGALEKKDKELSDKKKSIDELDSKEFEIDSSIANIEGQLSQISTNTDDAEANAENQTLINNLKTQLESLKKQKADIQKEKTAAEQEKVQLEKEKANLQKEVDVCLQNIASQNPTIAPQINDFKQQINKVEQAKIEAEKNYNAKIETAQTKEIENSRKAGEAKGKSVNNSDLIKQLLEVVYSEEMFKKWNGKAMSCSGFVGDCLRAIAPELPYMESKSCHGLPKLGKQNDAWLEVANMAVSEANKFLKENLRPGMVFLSNTNGQLHVGFVTKVYEDGSWDTMEANTLNTKTGQNQSVFSHHRTYEQMQNVMQGFIDIEKVIAAYRK